MDESDVTGAINSWLEIGRYLDESHQIQVIDLTFKFACAGDYQVQ